MAFQIPIQIIRKKRRVIGTHILVWMIFIFYENSFLYFLGTKLSSPLTYLLTYSTNASLFYANVWCLNYAFEKKKKFYIYVILILLEFTGYFILHFICDQLLAGGKIPLTAYLSKRVIILSTYRVVYFSGLSIAYWFALRFLKGNNMINKLQSRQLIQQKRSAELERNLFKAKNAYLTSQINPHLLFNTLNFIYSSLYDVSEKAAETVMLLSDMMRYSLTEIDDDGRVELWQEVEHIENMIKLNQARFNNELQINLYLNGDFNVRIIPLVLLTFIENIFKHGDLTDPNNPAKIHISYHNHTLDFHCSNKIRAVNINKGSGIGIENSKLRLDITYPKKYKLHSKVVDDLYVTELIIRFNKSNS